MTENHIDTMRELVVRDLFATKSMKKVWPVWQPQIAALLPSVTASGVLGLGSKLSMVFGTTARVSTDEPKSEADTQSENSVSGHIWEALICWYLNLCLIGTHSIVYKKRTHVPDAIRDAVTVGYHNVATNAESDLLAVSFPERQLELSRPLEFKEKLSGRLNTVAEESFREVRVAVVQCKTNWNDNAQIPMLWDMVYRGEFKRGTGVLVGQKQHHPSGLASFHYAFVTVPSNKLVGYKSTSVAVQRVSQLTGGNYWGREERSGVALSVDAIFAKAGIGPSGGVGIRASLARALPQLTADYGYFGVP